MKSTPTLGYVAGALLLAAHVACFDESSVPAGSSTTTYTAATTTNACWNSHTCNANTCAAGCAPQFDECGCVTGCVCATTGTTYKAATTTSAGSSDAGSPDAGSSDAGPADAAVSDGGCGAPAALTYACEPVAPDAGGCVQPAPDGGALFFPLGCISTLPVCAPSTDYQTPIHCTCALGTPDAQFVCIE